MIKPEKGRNFATKFKEDIKTQNHAPEMERVLRTLLAIMALSVSASANAVETDTLAYRLNEISVTALKESNVSWQPHAASTTTVTGREVEKLNIMTMKDVSEIAPNFYIPDYGSRMTSSIYVRGLGARIDQPAVGLIVDNVSYLNKDNYDFDLVDIERIEVKRGPQSTLYGRNTMAGVVDITTLSPMRYQGVRLMAEAGNGSTFKGALAGYMKISPKLAMSLSGNYHYTGGFFTNVHSGAKADRESGGSTRWKTVLLPSESITIENTASLTINRQHGYPYASAETGLINYNDTCFYKRTSFSDGLSIKWETSHFTLTSITSLQTIDDNMTLDQDFLPASYFTLTQKRRELALTQDIIASGKTGNRYKWLAGAFFFHKRARMSAPVTFKETGIAELIEKHRNESNPYYPIKWDDDSFVLNSDFVNPVTGWALYHNSSYETGRWAFSAGLRLDIEKTSLDYHSHCATSYTTFNATGPVVTPERHHPVTLNERGRLNRTFVQLLPSFTVSYTLPFGKKSTISASVAKGYKSGGFNTQMFSDVLQQSLMETLGLTSTYEVDRIVTYQPEKSWNYELGLHLDLTDKVPLKVDIATFYINCLDQQLTMFPDGTTTGRIMANAGKTRSMGVEVTLNYAPTARWTFDASWGLTDAKFIEFNNGISDFSGCHIPYAPKNTLYIGTSYTQPVNSSILKAVRLTANCRGVGDIYWDEANTSRQKFYGLAGLSVTLMHDRYTLDLWGENLTDTRYFTFEYVSIGNRFHQQGKPFTIGATLRLNFDTNF